ncbi:MAG: hypothetical protein WC709_05280 [Thermoleophilia bacterium]
MRRLLVKAAPCRPYGVSLAIAMASSKISPRAMLLNGVLLTGFRMIEQPAARAWVA